MIDTKKDLIEELKKKKNEYTKTNIEYKKEKCKLMLETNFEEVLGKSRPTVGEKEAYVDLNTIDMREKKELLYNEIEYLKLQIELCNDEIELECLRL